MITASQLRLGNYIQNCGTGKTEQVYQLVTSIGESVNEKSYPKSFKQIPINKDWLLKFGFTHADEDDYFLDLHKPKAGRTKDDDFRGCSIKASVVKGGVVATLVDENGWDISRDFYFVHELQNLWHALTGEELTIEDECLKSRGL